MYTANASRHSKDPDVNSSNFPGWHNGPRQSGKQSLCSKDFVVEKRPLHFVAFDIWTWPHDSFLFDILVSNQRLPCETLIVLEKEAWWMMLFVKILEPHPSHVILKKGICSFKGTAWCQFQCGTREAGSVHPWRFRGIHVLGWKVGESHPTLPDILKQQVCPWRPSRPFPAFPKGGGFIWSNLWSLGYKLSWFQGPGYLGFYQTLQ